MHIKKNREKNQTQICGIPPPVKKQRTSNQPGNGNPVMPSSTNQIKPNERDREKQKNKDVGVE